MQRLAEGNQKSYFLTYHDCGRGQKFHQLELYVALIK